MGKKVIFLILILAFLLRLVPILGNNFYFTVDQGRDAVMVRDILHGSFKLVGPVSGIKDVYHGALWYYWLTPAYLLFGGHPFGPVFFQVILSAGTIFFIFKMLPKIGEAKIAVPAAFLLSVFVPFYETSRYAFNPFLLPFISIVFLFALCLTSKINKKYFIIAGIATGAVFHSEIVAFIPFALTYILTGLIFLFRKKLRLNYFFLGIGAMGIFLLPHLLAEITSGFAQTNSLWQNLTSTKSILGVSPSQQLSANAGIFYTMLGEIVLPQMPRAGGIVYLLVILSVVILKRGKVSPFVIYTFLLLAISFGYFSMTNLIRTWYFAYLPVILLLSFLITIAILPKKLFLLISLLLIVLHSGNLLTRLNSYSKDSGDASLLKNQLSTLDWIYQKSENEPFYVYFYVPSVYDYQYQYLTFWYARKKYGYLPCEYSTYPGTDASSYVPRSELYQSQTGKCSKLVFLLMEPAVHEPLLNEWQSGAGKDTELLEKAKIGQISLEKRKKITSQ